MTLDRLRQQYSLVYLASPYTRYYGGIDAAFRMVSYVASILVKAGVPVYSPICHTHPIAVYGGIDPVNFRIWSQFNMTMMQKSDAAVVAMMTGWEDSAGVTDEIDWFVEQNKPVAFLDVTSWRLTQPTK